MSLSFIRGGVLAAAACLAVTVPALAQQAVIMVRHAEKADDEADDPVLSDKGTKRAEALAAHLAEAQITAIYVTQYQRTGLTAAPTAAKLRITPARLDSDAIDELVQKMRTDHPNDVVLYVGHNNSVGKIAKAYGHPEAFVIDPAEYDNLFILVPKPGKPPTLLRLKY